MSCDQYCHEWWGTWWPWAEANQGMLSVAAIVLTATLALMEFRRANKAEALAKKIADDAEAAEERRANEAIEREARLTREAEERRREEQINAELARLAEYTSAARSMVRDVEIALEDERTKTLSFIAGQSPSVMMINTMGSGRARTASESLNAIAHAAPLDPKLILITRKAVITLAQLGTNQPIMSYDGVGKWFSEQLESLTKIREELTDQEIALAHRIRAPILAANTSTAMPEQQF